MKIAIGSLFTALLLFLPVQVPADEFTLLRASVMYSDGTIVDSLRSGWDISGHMSINGNRATQSITVCGLKCVTGSASATLQYFGENAHSVTIRNDNSVTSEIILLNGVNSPISTFITGGSFAEVDQWVPGSSPQSAADASKMNASKSFSLEKPGNLLGELLKIVKD